MKNTNFKTLSNNKLSEISAGMNIGGGIWYLYGKGDGIKQKSRAHEAHALARII